MGDIEKAFLRIIIALEDRDVLRFFWPRDPCNPSSIMIEYRWKAVLFGSISSPFILATVLKRLLSVISLFNTVASMNGEDMLPNNTAFHLYSIMIELGLHGSRGQKKRSTSLSSRAIMILRKAFSMSPM